MQAAPARYVSVSELYSTDEVELLLDEIRELEPTSCRGEDVQDFEIAGSGCGGGGRSPAGTELTERSWDSHAQYRRAPAPRARALAPLYWRARRLLAPGAALALCGAGASACVWAAAGLRAGAAPLGARLQLLLLGALSSALLHGALLAMHVTRLAALLPLDWAALGALTALWSCASLGAGGALVLHGVLRAPEYRAAPARLAAPLLAGAALALGGALLAGGVAAAGARKLLRRRAAYRAVPPAPPGAEPGPSRAAPL